MDDQNYQSDTFIVTVNYKSEQVLLNFLESLNHLEHTESRVQVIIVDSSGELKPSIISAISRHKTEIIRLPINQGFAYAANIGLRTSLQYAKLLKTSCYVWLLNPDTIIHPEAFARLIKHSNSNTILGSAVTNEGFTSESTIWGAGGTVDHNLNVDMQYHAQFLSTVPETPFECDYIPGCSMFIPVQILEKYGYLPEEFFLYFEETDWCLNLKRNGVILKIVPKSLIQHFSEAGKMDSPYRIYFYNRNQIYFKFKHFTKKKEKIDLLLKTISKIPKLILLVIKEKDENLRKTFFAHLFANFDVAKMLFMYATNLKLWKNNSLERLEQLKK